MSVNIEVNPADQSLNSANQQPIAPEPPRPENVETPTPTPEEITPPTHRIRNTLSTIGLLLLAPLIAILLTAYVFQSYQVDGPSMQNTLHNNDRLIVWKLPRTWARITNHAFIPNRGDIIIFSETGLANYGDSTDSKQLIKRVIGLPGDRVVVKDGSVTVYNQAHPQGFKPDTTLPYGQNGAIPFTADNIDITLGDNQLFVCGDNRGDSLDSRTFGPIEANQVIGKLVVRVLPLSQAKRF